MSVMVMVVSIVIAIGSQVLLFTRYAQGSDNGMRIAIWVCF